MIKIKTDEGIENLMNSLATIVSLPSGETYRYLPFWFKTTDVHNEVLAISFEKLPNELKDHIKSLTI